MIRNQLKESPCHIALDILIKTDTIINKASTLCGCEIVTMFVILEPLMVVSFLHFLPSSSFLENSGHFESKDPDAFKYNQSN